MKLRHSIRAAVALALIAPSAPPARAQPSSPGPRTGGVMVYDDARHRVVMFGGHGAPGAATEYPNDLWAWDGQRWRELVPADSTKPPGRDVPTIAYDRERRRVVMFGGRRDSGNSSQLLSDVWEWDGTRWYEIRDAGLEPVLHAVAGYDPVRKRVVIYGGVTDTGMSRALREWDGKRWITRDDGGLAALTAATLATTPRGEIIVVGLTPTADSDPVPPPSARSHVWTGVTWLAKEQGPPMANLQPTGSAPDGTVYVYQAWERWVTEPITHVRLPDGTWTHLTTPTNPGIRTTLASAYDPARKRFVVFGGNTRNGLLGDTWEFDGRTWERRQ